MTTFFRELIRFAIGKTKHPIYNREQVGWSYIGAWRRIRKGCIPLIMLLLFGTACFCGGSCGLTTVPNATPSEVWPLILVAVAIGFMAGETILHFITGLLATTLAATVISAEIEAQTFGLLRMTPIPVREIVLAKYGAALYQIRTPTLANMLVRALMLLTAVLVIIGLFVAAMFTATSPTEQLDLPPLAITAALAGTYGLAAASVLVAVLIWAIYYIMRPLLDMMMFAAIGLFASSFAKTRSGGLVTAGAFRLVMWIVSYVMSQVFSSMLTLATMPFMMMPGIPQWIEQSQVAPGILVIAGSGFGIVLIVGAVALQIAVVYALLTFTTNRAKHLPSLG